MRELFFRQGVENERSSSVTQGMVCLLFGAALAIGLATVVAAIRANTDPIRCAVDAIMTYLDEPVSGFDVFLAVALTLAFLVRRPKG